MMELRDLMEMMEPKYPCTQCRGDAFIGYGPGWSEKVQAGERLCTRCFKARGGENIFAKSGT